MDIPASLLLLQGRHGILVGKDVDALAARLPPDELRLRAARDALAGAHAANRRQAAIDDVTRLEMLVVVAVAVARRAAARLAPRRPRRRVGRGEGVRDGQVPPRARRLLRRRSRRREVAGAGGDAGAAPPAVDGLVADGRLGGRALEHEVGAVGGLLLDNGLGDVEAAGRGGRGRPGAVAGRLFMLLRGRGGAPAAAAAEVEDGDDDEDEEHEGAAGDATNNGHCVGLDALFVGRGAVATRRSGGRRSRCRSVQ